MRKAIHRNEAFDMLADGKEHKLRLWKLGTKDFAARGEILTYKRAVFVSRYVRGGTHKVRLVESGSVRAFRDICLFEIDDLKIYL